MPRLAIFIVLFVLLVPSAALADLSPERLAAQISADAEPLYGWQPDSPAVSLIGPRGGGLDLDPGQPPEGDYLGWPVYTRDGQRILVSNRGTNNVTVLDAATQQVLANIEVGTYPAGIAVSDDYAVVACAFADEAWIVDLADLSVAAVIPTSEQPWVVRTSPDGTLAFVSCDIPDVCEVIDLAALSLVRSIADFPVSLLTFSFGSENGRNGVTFTGFEVTPDGLYLVTGDRDDSVDFFAVATGALAYSVTGVPDCTTVGLSGDGAYLIALSASSAVTAHRIDLAGPTVVGSVTVPGYSLSTHQVGVNQDGTKAFLGISSNSSCFVNFATGDYTVLTSTYTPFALGTSPDHTLAIGIQYRFSILEFDREILLGQWQGISTNIGAVAPVGSQVAAYDPIRDESLNFFDYTVPGSPQWIGATPSGAPPEGDCPRRIAITPDGATAAVTNVLSDNTSLIDLATGQMMAILATGDRPQDLAITPDSRWAVVTGMDSHSVFVVDLELQQVVAEVPTALRPGVVSLTPDGAFAYVGNIQANTVSVIELAGAASTEIAEIPCGVIGVSWAGYGVSSAVVVSPDGAHCLVAASFDDQVKVIDTVTNSVVASLAVGDFPLQIAFEATGQYATVTNWFGDSYSVLEIDGAASSVVGTFAADDGPLRIAYDAVNDVIGIGHYYDKTVVSTDPRTGERVGTQSYGAYGNLLQCGFDGDGRVLALTTASGDAAGHFHQGVSAHALPAAPSYFADHDASGAAGVVMPGPDWVTLFGTGTTAVQRPVGLDGPGVLLPPGPNPGSGPISVAFRLRDATTATVAVYDLAGRRVATLTREDFPAGLNRLTWDGRDDGGRLLAAGTYFVDLQIGGWHQTQKLVRVR